MKTRSAPGRTNPAAAGIDLGATVHYVAVPADRDENPARHYGTLTEDLIIGVDQLHRASALSAQRLLRRLNSSSSHFTGNFNSLKKRASPLRSHTIASPSRSLRYSEHSKQTSRYPTGFPFR